MHRFYMAGLILAGLIAFGPPPLSGQEETSLTEPQAQKIALDLIVKARQRQTEALEKSWPQVRPQLEKAAQKYPGNEYIHLALGMGYFTKKDKNNFLRVLARAHKHHPRSRAVVVFYSMALKVNHRPLEAWKVVDQWAKVVQHPQAEFMLAIQEVLIQKYSSAQKRLEKLVKHPQWQDPRTQCLFHQQLGICHLYQGRFDQAREHFQRSLSFTPNVRSYTGIGEILVKTGKVKEAVSYLKKALEINDQHDQALYFLGLAREKLGQTESAKKLYQSAEKAAVGGLKVTDENGEDHFFLALVREKLGQFDKAQKARKTAAKLLFTYQARPGKAGDQ